MMSLLFARRVARECSLMVLFVLENSQQQLPTSPVASEDLTRLMKSSVFSLVSHAEQQLEEAARSVQKQLQTLQQLAAEDPSNLARPLNAPDMPVALPTTQTMQEQLNNSLYAMELIHETFRIPQLLIQADQPEVQLFTHQLVNLVCQHSKELESIIDHYSNDWRSQRLFKMDRLILKQGLAELIHVPDIDRPITLNESIELAKQFSTEESHRLVNGILGNVAQRLANGAALLTPTANPA
ncbi:MAG: transcription antitermination factor NusB [Cuspidothrix sp.]